MAEGQGPRLRRPLYRLLRRKLQPREVRVRINEHISTPKRQTGGIIEPSALSRQLSVDRRPLRPYESVVHLPTLPPRLPCRPRRRPGRALAFGYVLARPLDDFLEACDLRHRTTSDDEHDLPSHINGKVLRRLTGCHPKDLLV